MPHSPATRARSDGPGPGSRECRSRQRDTLGRQFLVMNAVCRKAGEQNSDQCNKTGDEAQPNHSFTQIGRVGKWIELPSDNAQDSYKSEWHDTKPLCMGKPSSWIGTNAGRA